jgi:hypothetical protein
MALAVIVSRLNAQVTAKVCLKILSKDENFMFFSNAL